MKNLMILVKMQLKERLNFKRLDVENVNVLNIVVSILGAIIKFALVFVLCAAFLLVATKLSLFAINQVPSTVISFIFTIMMLLSIFSCVVGLTKSMYYARDNAVLLTLPSRPIQLYLSKLIIFFVFELKRNLSFMVPLFLAYFFTHGYGIGAYPWMLFCMIFVSLFTVAIGALLSIPAMWIANFFRQNKWLQMSTLTVIVVSAIVALFYAIALIPVNIDIRTNWVPITNAIHDFFKAYATNFSWVYDITRLMLGETVGLVRSFPIGATALRFLALFAATFVLLLMGVLIVKPLFYSMASKPFEYLKKPTNPKQNTRRKRRWSSIFYEWLIAIKSTNRMFSNVGIFISIPILIFLLNKIFLAMNTRAVGNHMVVAFNVLITLLVALNSNCSVASIFSRDGRSSYLIKTQPSSYPILIFSKLLPDTTFVCVSIFATFIVMLFTLSLGLFNTVILAASICMVYLSHMLYSAELDLMNPQIELYATVGNTENNPNETKSTAMAFLISFVIAAAIFLLLLEGKGGVYVKFLVVALLALCYRTYIFFAKLKLYYNEK